MDPAAVLLLQFAIWIAGGCLVGYLGSQRGRHPVGWFFIGVAAPCIGLILVLVLPDLRKTAEDEKKKARENRRLREQLSQERMKNQAFRGHTTHRLDAHDQAIGVDTRTAAPASELPPVPPQEQLEDGLPAENWFLVQPGEEAEGPFTLDKMRTNIGAQIIGPKTLVYHESLGDWTPLDQSPLKVLL